MASYTDQCQLHLKKLFSKWKSVANHLCTIKFAFFTDEIYFSLNWIVTFVGLCEVPIDYLSVTYTSVGKE